MIPVIWIVSSFRLYVSASIQCTTSDYAGVVDPESYHDKYENKVGWGFVVRRPSYVFPCCGVVEKWEVHVEEAGTLEMQVWRADTGSQEKLVGENSLLTTIGSVANELMFVINITKQITVVPGDAIGWRTAGTEVLTYSDIKNDDKLVYHDESMPDVHVGGKHTFPKDDKKDRMYAVKAHLAPGSPPSFVNLPDSVTMTDSIFPGFTVFSPVITDANPLDTHNFTHAGSLPSYFSIDVNTGVVKVAKELLPATFTIYLVVTDICGLQDTQQLSITVTGPNHAPKLENMPGIGHVNEDFDTEQLVYNLTVTDSDPVQCSLFDSEPDNAQFLLKIHKAIAEFGVYLKAGANLSYSLQSSYELNVTCTDGSMWSSDIIYVYVKSNAPPVFQNLPGSTSISARTATTGTSFFTIGATDDDDTNLVFTMSCVLPQCPFNMSNGGYLYPTSSLIHDKTGIYDVTVTVTDGKYTTGPSLLTIIITNRNSPPVISGVTKSLLVSEHTAPLTSLLTLSITDVDAQDSPVCSVDIQPASGVSIFIFDSLAYNLRLGQNAVIDYELLTVTTFNLTFVATDFIDVTSVSVLISINDENDAPMFTSQTAYIQINESDANTKIGTVPSHVDQDVHEVLQFKILGGTGSGFFDLNPTSGDLFFKVDYDVDVSSFPSDLFILIEIRDGGGLTDNCTVFINVIDLNDNAPHFNATSYIFKVNANAQSGVTIGTVQAEDSDSGINSLLTYTIDPVSNIKGKFLIPNSGEIISIVPMSEFQGQNTVSFILFVTDSGSPSQSSSINVTVVIETSITPVANSGSSVNSSFHNTVLAVATETGSVPSLKESTEWKVLMSVSLLGLVLLLVMVACQVHQVRRRSKDNKREGDDHHPQRRQITPKPLSHLHRMKSSTLLLKDTDFWKQGSERNSHATLSRTMSNRQFTPTAPMSTRSIQSSLSKTSTGKDGETFPRIIRVDGAHEYGSRNLHSERTALRF